MITQTVETKDSALIMRGVDFRDLTLELNADGAVVLQFPPECFTAVKEAFAKGEAVVRRDIPKVDTKGSSAKVSLPIEEEKAKSEPVNTTAKSVSEDGGDGKTGGAAKASKGKVKNKKGK